MNQTSGSLSSRALNWADLNKPRTEISIQKRSSSACKIACSRLYENAIKHQEYINAKMKENGIKQIDFVNRSSREIVSKMQDKRKPLYHLIERKDQQLEDIQYFLQARTNFYLIIERTKSSKSEANTERIHSFYWTKLQCSFAEESWRKWATKEY